MNPLYILGRPLGWVLWQIYELIPSFGWSIILLTIAVRLISFPLQIKQQKSMVRMSAYQPMIQEIQNKYKNHPNPQKQQEELMQLQQEYGFSPTAGCFPMFLNFAVMFGIIDAVYRPLQYIVRLSSETIAAAGAALGLAGGNNLMLDTQVLQKVQELGSGAAAALNGTLTAAQIEAIQNFNMNFFGIDLAVKPTLAFNNLLIFPLLSVITMILLNIITTKMSGQQLTGAMKWMPWFMSIFFITFCFQVPVGFSLYYTVSNLLMFLQSVLLKKMYNPEEYKKKLAEEIAEKKAAKHRKKEVSYVDAKGQTVTTSVTPNELNKLRLEMARREDEAKYANEITTNEELAAWREEQLAQSGKKKKK